MYHYNLIKTKNQDSGFYFFPKTMQEKNGKQKVQSSKLEKRERQRNTYLLLCVI
jgi:hypothetical protein